MFPRMAAGGTEQVVWTRGKGCAELAELLASGVTARIQGDLAEECIEHRADLLVSRKMPGSFDLVNVAVPVDFDPLKVTQVVATVAGGPHSLLAASTARTLASALDVNAEMVSAAGPEGSEVDAREVLEQLGDELPGVSRRVVQVEGFGELVEQLEPGALLVIGAPGGSWLQRSVMGPGAKLRRTAQAGAVIVRSAPERVFRFMGEPVYVAPLRAADDTLRFHREGTLAVADEGRLVGVVKRADLLEAGASAVGTVMEEAVSVKQDDTLDEAQALEPTFGPDPIPVTDDDERLVGGLLLPVA